MDRFDTDRLELLDRIAELDLDRQTIDWTELDDGHQALLVNGGGIDGGDGAYFVNAADDPHAFGSLAPIIEGYISSVVIRLDGSRYITAVQLDPLAQQ